MLSETTAAKIDHGIASLELDKLCGTAPPPGDVSIAEIARRSGVSEKTVARIDRVALAKVARQLAQTKLPPHLARKLSSLLNPTHP